ncbi:hypothetical protein STRDD04_01926 [Streptococcus sp. DD04]|nr:hypothetical protein STRDD04_01926 [Streptococcus sp. DD04]
MFSLQIYLIIEFKIPYYSIINAENSQTYFSKKTGLFFSIIR